MQVISDTGASDKLWDSLGTGLQQLAQNKLAQVQRQYDVQSERSEYAKSIAPFVGPEAAKIVSNLNPEMRQWALNDIPSLMKLVGQQGAPQQGGLPALQAGQPAQEQAPEQVQGLTGADILGGVLNDASVSPLVRQALAKTKVQLPNMPAAAMGQAPEGAAVPQEAGLTNQSFPTERAQLIQNILTSPESREKKEKMALELKKIKSREDLAAWKNTLPYREETQKIEEASRDALHAIKAAKEIEKSGNFPSQQFASFLEGAGWQDVPGFLSGDAEAYNKILANFQKGAKDIYGGRITNFEMEQFLKTIPSLQHTPEGRAKIWAMMEHYYRGGKERGKLERQIIKENGGVPPQDLHERVNERFKPIAKDLSKRFKRDLQEAQKLAESNSRLGSVAAYGAGKVAGAIPAALKGAAKGALSGAAAGSFIPVLGTGTGALIGGGLGALSGGLGGSGGLGDILKLLL